MSAATRYGLRCVELGDAPNDLHDFVLADEYDRLEERCLALEKAASHVVEVWCDDDLAEWGMGIGYDAMLALEAALAAQPGEGDEE